MTAWTPPPPGSDRDKLPDHVLAVVDLGPYDSTACQMARALEAAALRRPDMAEELLQWAGRMHASCRLTRKQDMAPCQCPHHQQAAAR